MKARNFDSEDSKTEKAKGKKMFYSRCLISSKGPLGAIWMAAYFFTKLKKSQVIQTDISSSVDKMLQDEFDVLTYRVLAYLLLGVVRIFSKKVEYLFDDCNKVLHGIKDFMVSNKDRTLVDTLCAPYFSITLPERFELDAFDLEILEDTSGEDCHDKAEHLRALEALHMDETHTEPIMQDLWCRNISEEAGLNFELFCEVEVEPVNPAKSFVECHLTDEQQRKLSDMRRLAVENLEIVKEDCNQCNLEVSMEKPLKNMVTQDQRDIETFCMVEEPREHIRSFVEERHCFMKPPENNCSFGEKYQSSAEHKMLLETTTLETSMYEALKEDCPLSITIATTPQSKSSGTSGGIAPETLVFPTPAAKEGARVRRKRKCLFDDMIVFPNNVIKQRIQDSTDLVCKRRKAPHTSLDAWMAWRFSSLPQCFFEPLIPCFSLKLGSLFRGKKLEISEPLDDVNLPQTPMAQCPVAGSMETVENLENLNKSKTCTDVRFVGTMKCLAKLNMSASPTVDSLAETAEPSQALNVSESPTAGRSLDQVAIAPETPVLHAKSPSSFRSPERTDISNFDIRVESERVEKELFPSKEQEHHLNLMTEEINSCEGHRPNCYEWSERRREVVRFLHKGFLNQKKIRAEEVVNFLQLLEGRTREESARLFYEILVLKSEKYVHVIQENAYSRILIWKTSQWEQAYGEDRVEAECGQCVPLKS